jgi:hypothetical protein
MPGGCSSKAEVVTVVEGAGAEGCGAGSAGKSPSPCPLPRGEGTNTPAGMPALPVALPVQPIGNIGEYLERRVGVGHWAEEERLFVTLPSNLKSEIRMLLGTRPGGGVFGHVSYLVEKGCSVQGAVASARGMYRVPGSLKRLRARYDLWRKSGDWVCLVNRAKAGAEWQDREDGLPVEFLKFCAKRFGQYKRADGKRQALLAIKRQWVTGRNNEGVAEEVPGYEKRQGTGAVQDASRYPSGWSYSNILRQIKAAGLFGRAVRAMLHEGTAAARSFIPQARFDRNGGEQPLRFLEEVQFDDVKVDFLVIDPESGQVCDLWLLVARDVATAILLGFGLRPARTREDGTQEHLRLRDMKQLCGWLLERYGLAPYEMVWKVEHGTATLSAGTRAALRELLPGRIDISFSSMIGGVSAAGYQQRAVGNSKGKASLESHNRLMHTMLADRPGQTGPLYNVRPADLGARAKEGAQIWETARQLPAHLRNEVGYPILTINQAREHLFRIFRLQNERTEHGLQGFEEVVEWWDGDGNRWRAANTFSGDPRVGGVQFRKRKESPIERCGRLIGPYRGEWECVSPEVVAAFYEHTVKQVTVKDNGLIEFTTEGRQVEFMPAPGCGAQVPGTKLLGYFHPDDPAFLHLTDGRGGVVGTWMRRGRAHDEGTLQTAIRYSQAALKAVKAQAAEYEAEERARLEAMRARNAELLASNTFVEVAGTGQANGDKRMVGSAVASALAGARAEVKRAEKQERDEAAAARAALRRAAERF